MNIPVISTDSSLLQSAFHAILESRSLIRDVSRNGVLANKEKTAKDRIVRESAAACRRISDAHESAGRAMGEV